MSTESIFVSIACLSDPDIILTIKDAIKKALHPEKLSFGVCLQILEDDKKSTEDSIDIVLLSDISEPNLINLSFGEILEVVQN